MQYLIYYHLRSEALRQQLITGLQHIAEEVFTCRELITINSYCTPLTLDDLLQGIQDFIAGSVPDKEDILYIFYPTEDQRMSLWPLKRAGKTRMLKWKTGIIADLASFS